MLALLACGPAAEQSSESQSPASAQGRVDSDPSRLRLSDGGRYRVSLRPASGEVPIGEIHSWIFHVESLDGEELHPARITVAGGMPQHDHGFVTNPRVSEVLGGGEFLVEGVKFHMPGAWVLRFEIVYAGSGDVATFDVQVDP